MALQNFVDRVGPIVSAVWLNAVDLLKETVFENATTKAQARTNLTSDAPLEVVNGGTGTRNWTTLYPPANNVKYYGAVGNGVADDTVAIQAALDAVKISGGTLYFPKGTYLITGTLTTDAAVVEIQGDGDSTVLDLTSNGKLYIKSTISALPALSANITAGTDVISFASAHGLAEGDVVLAYNPTDYSFGVSRTYYRDGCMFRASTITSSTAIKTYGMALATYGSAAVSMYKVNGGKVSLENFKVLPPTTGIGVWIDAHQSVTVHSVTLAPGAEDTAMEIYRCFDVDVKDVKSSARAGNAYPVMIANSQKVTVSNCSLYSIRHCLALGGRDEAGAVPTRNVLVDHCILENDGALGIGAADMHGNVENVMYSNCIINSHAQMSGKNVTYSSCKIYGRPAAYYADGCCIYGSEISGGLFRVENCEFITWGNLTSFAAIHLSAKDILEDFRLVVHASRVRNKAASPTTAKVVTVIVGDSNPPASRIDVDIRDLTYEASVAASQILVISGANDISATSSYIVDDILAPPASALIGCSNAANYTAPMRLQEQEYSEVLTTPGGTGASATSSLWTFRYPYPKVPNVFVSLGSSDGTLQTGVRGGKVVVPFVRSYTVQAARFGVNSSDNLTFTSSEGVRVSGKASIREL